jgi:hypothetical protein
LSPDKRNQRLSPLGGDTASNYLGDKIFIQSRSKNLDKGSTLDDSPNVKQRMDTIDPKDLIGRTFLMDSEKDGQRFRARVVRVVVDKEEELKKGL